MTDKLTEAEIRKAQEILMEQLGVTREQIQPEARIMDDLGADSLDMVEIAMSAEEEFSFTLPDDQTEKIETVEDFYEAIAAFLERA